ncbi:thymidine phosphorylase [Rhizobium rhizosphaerae]|uniref:thymidine phosphorylase n=1 Tax=Xaviernesmea rhizosphaerae TaxID=1672749 RepID=A0ABX3PE25_9HYPH|nr:thymidine phosphorylase [Xaviernesmea rhizosphaerae]OQP86519.1 thymidine phosphorylase [Xaviernesmea rhizosphaerae]
MSVSDEPFLPQAVIRKKRDREELGEEDLRRFMAGAVDGSVSEGQIGAFTMAVYLNGMTADERVRYALAMRDSGRVLDWSAVGLSGATLIDKHSSGGVGDEKVSLIVAPLVAACGIHMPMISARGLGYTGGEVDLLDAIPGYDIAPPTALFMEAVKEIGCAIIGPTPELAPADRPIYYVRDVAATVESIPLITGSILSKKLAAGISGLVMTVPFGSGAFMGDKDDAMALAESLIAVAKGAGLKMTALLSDLSQILGDSVGSALQLREVIAFLRGDARERRLLETVLALSEEILLMGAIAQSRPEARRMAMTRLDDGSALARFAAMVQKLGGPDNFIVDPDAHLPRAAIIAPVHPDMEGYVAAMDCQAIGFALVAIGAGRKRPGDAIDHAVGLSGIAQVGTKVDKDKPLCTLHAANQNDWHRAASAIRAAITLCQTRGAERKVIDGRM